MPEFRLDKQLNSIALMRVVVVTVTVLAAAMLVATPGEAVLPATTTGTGVGTGTGHTNNSGPFTCCPPCSTLNAVDANIDNMVATFTAQNDTDPELVATYGGPVIVTYDMDLSGGTYYLGPHGIYTNANCTNPAANIPVDVTVDDDASDPAYVDGGLACSNLTGTYSTVDGVITITGGSCVVTDTALGHSVTAPLKMIIKSHILDPTATRDPATGDAYGTNGYELAPDPRP